jgi:hypothetical protein
MFEYHVTSKKWLLNGSNRIAFQQYIKPPLDQPYRDHAPLNQALESNPGASVYRAFFFDDEEKVLQSCSLLQVGLPDTVVLRVKVSHDCFAGHTRADDDKDLTPGAHMWFSVDSALPYSTSTRLYHPTWGVPFDAIDIWCDAQSGWMPIAAWIKNNLPSVPTPHKASTPARGESNAGRKKMIIGLTALIVILIAFFVVSGLHR